MFLQKKRNCCCSLPRSFIRYGIYCRAYWLELVTYTQWLCLQQYLPTQNTLTKSLILISMRGNKSQTLWRNEVHYSNSFLNVSLFFFCENVMGKFFLQIIIVYCCVVEISCRVCLLEKKSFIVFSFLLYYNRASRSPMAIAAISDAQCCGTFHFLIDHKM